MKNNKDKTKKVFVEPGSCLLQLTTAGCHGLADVAAYSARISLGALAADRKMACVTDSAVRFDVAQTADVGGNLALELALDRTLLYSLAKRCLLRRGEVLRLHARINLELKKG